MPYIFSQFDDPTTTHSLYMGGNSECMSSVMSSLRYKCNRNRSNDYSYLISQERSWRKK